MSENITLQNLFTQGLTKEEFVQKYFEIKESSEEESSIFTDDFANSLSLLFDTINTNGNDTIDEDEIINFQGMGDNDNTSLSEADIKALYTKMGQDILAKNNTNLSPEQMYNIATTNNNGSSTYIQDLGQQMSSLQELISLRQFNSTNLQQMYQSQIDDIIKKDTTLTTEQKAEYLQLSKEKSELQREYDKNAAEIRKIEEQLRENDNETAVVQAQLAHLDPQNEDDASGIETWTNSLNELLSDKEDLEFVHSNLTQKNTMISSKLSVATRKLEAKNDEILAGNPELKTKIVMFNSMIEQEKQSCQLEIESYEAHISTLKSAQAYAIEQLRNQPPIDIDGEGGSHQNDNLMSFNELRAQGYEYSGENGQKLAGIAKRRMVGFTGYCSRYVSNALAESGLGKERCGSAADMDTKLENNPNFKEIKVSSAEDLKRLPAGCILVYERGAAGYNAKHGHIEITIGDSTAISDGRTRNLRYTTNMSVFVPVKRAA